MQQGKEIRKSGKLKKLFELMWRKEKEKKEEWWKEGGEWEMLEKRMAISEVMKHKLVKQ